MLHKLVSFITLCIAMVCVCGAVPVYAAEEGGSPFDYFEFEFPTSEAELPEDEEPADGWSITQYLYEQDGTTPLSYFYWEPKTTATTQFVSQINYKGSGGENGYQPGELEICTRSIYNDIYQSPNELSYWIKDKKVIIAADNWDYRVVFKDGSYYLKFTNKFEVKPSEAFEGSFQISYIFMPENCRTKSRGESHAELFANGVSKCVSGDTVLESYMRLREYKITASPTKLTALDGLDCSIDDYYIIRWRISVSIVSSNIKQPLPRNVYQFVPEGCRVFGSNLKEITAEPDGKYDMGSNSTIVVFIAYPKDVYSAGVDNHVELWHMDEDNNFVKQREHDYHIDNIADFDFSYSGSLYGIEVKETLSGTNLSRPALLSGSKSKHVTWRVAPSVQYLGKELTVRIYHDFNFLAPGNVNLSEFKDSGAYFSSTTIPLFTNNNSVRINGDTCVSVYALYADSSDYEEVSSFLLKERDENSITYDANVITQIKQYNRSVYFDESRRCISYYIQLDGLNEGLAPTYPVRSVVKYDCSTYDAQEFDSQPIYIYTAAGLMVYQDGVLVNEPDIYSYTGPTGPLLSKLDTDVYGRYVQRGWSYIQIPDNPLLDIETHVRYESYNVVNDEVSGKHLYEMRAGFYNEQANGYENLSCLDFYIFTPYGCTVADSANISNSIEITSTTKPQAIAYPSSFDSLQSYRDYLGERCSTDFIEDWRNTGMNCIHVRFSFEDEPFYIGYNRSGTSKYPILDFYFTLEIPCEIIQQFGSSFNLFTITDITPVDGSVSGCNSLGSSSYSPSTFKLAKDDGSVKISGGPSFSYADVDGDGNEEEYVGFTVTSIATTHLT